MSHLDSLWWDGVRDEARPRLTRDIDVDVCIVGAGYTGLWTALGLHRRQPSLRIAIVEQHVAGAGASGRNGGWASALFPAGETTCRIAFGERAAAIPLLLQQGVRDLGRTLESEGIDADFHLGGTLIAARNGAHEQRLRHEASDQWLDHDEFSARLRMSGARGGTFTPHCARLHPGKLVRGLAETVESRGVALFEHTAAMRIVPGSPGRSPRVVTRDATVRAGIVVNAVEAFAASQPNRHRDVVPLYSLMIATEPLPESFFDEVGLREYETFADGRHLVVYGQRTADNRLAFGGRGAPYHVGSTIEERFDHDRRTFALLESTLRDMFPSLSASITHRWGGPLGMTRSNLPYCVVDHRTGLAAAGGYTGDGVVLSRLMGEALATWITVGDASPALPCFAQPLSRRWEVEPLRWLGISAGLALAARADASETAGHLHPLSARLLEKLLRTQ